MSAPSFPQPEATYAGLAGLIEYPLVQPQLSEEDVARGLETAKKHALAAVIVRPSDVDLVARWIAGSQVRLAAPAGGPHGSATTAAKVYEARDLLRRGIREIDTVMNSGKLISRQFQYLETELLQMAEACRESGGILKVGLECEYLTEELKIVACRIARRAGAAFIGADRLEDIALLKSHSRERLKLKSSAHALDLEAALAAREAGCERIELSEPAAILEAWKARLAEQPAQRSNA